MPAPVPYTITTNFEDEEVNRVAGRSTVRTAPIDVELQNIATSIQSLIDNLSLIQRDDGVIADGAVDVNSLAAQVLSLLSGTTIVPRGDWSSASVVYSVGNLVRYATDTNIYICTQAHTSSGLILPTNTSYWQVWSYGFSSDAQLAAIAASVPAADRYHYWTSATSVALGTITAAARGLLDDADVSTMRSTLVVPSMDEYAPTVMQGRIVIAVAGGGVLGGDGLGVNYLSSSAPAEVNQSSSSQILMLVPFVGTKVGVYDNANSKWVIRNLDMDVGSGVNPQIAIPAVANQTYDVFVYYNAGATSTGLMTLELVPWTSDTLRATPVIFPNFGRANKSGENYKLYLGTIRTNSVAGNVPDSPQQRFVFNYFNRTQKAISNYPTVNSYSYSVDAFREMNGVSTSRIEFLNPGPPIPVDCSITALCSNSSGTARRVQVGMGLNSAVTPQAPCGHGYVVSGENRQIHSRSVMVPTFGYNYIAPLERGAGSDTQTWYGTNAGTELAVGMKGMIEC